MDIWITGGAWVSAGGYGRLSEGPMPALTAGPAIIPPAKEVFTRPHSRYGRFDRFTTLGCAAVALTLKDAGCEEGFTEPVGMVVSTTYDVLETDAVYYQTTLEQGGKLSSPNLFSYTLPVIVLGECAVLFRLTGPTFCVGDQGGLGSFALKNAASMLASGKASRMLAGWIESPPADMAEDSPAVSGSMFVLLDPKPNHVLPYAPRIRYEKGELSFKNNTIPSLQNLFMQSEI